MTSLKGKTMFVSGGSRGIGKMIAIGFLQAGARVLGPLELEELDRIGGTGEPDVDL